MNISNCNRKLNVHSFFQIQNQVQIRSNDLDLVSLAQSKKNQFCGGIWDLEQGATTSPITVK